MLNAGNPTVVVAVKDKAAVDRAWLDLTGLRSLKDMESESFCVFVFTPTPNGAYSRMFAPEYGIPEDPATGSSAGPLAVFMMRRGLVSNAAGTRFVSEQGTRMGRRSLLHVDIQGENGTDGIHKSLESLRLHSLDMLQQNILILGQHENLVVTRHGHPFRKTGRIP